MQEQMGFWHPTASTQRFADDAVWLVLEQKPHRNTSTQNTSPNNSHTSRGQREATHHHPFFGVEINFLTSVLRNCHYADSFWVNFLLQVTEVSLGFCQARPPAPI